ncbi:hypothetical protein [Nostoc sphaeroides]|uniref:Uncharacterized protein n=1 Tax=Nostoc sphaeroides CCNUC1 TaxID=2653204 RepID=A0A5P8WDY6_9NOSO|nr:hypothetical protein [Nostoc sphaeroides]MCC5632705.1 hypothetical protein [Nostoc sphaeroides CHAB 2801]QFS50830.1 hypothetical protein GXM_08324 [Nostoc sphaeroides CCNUC1]
MNRNRYPGFAIAPIVALFVIQPAQAETDKSLTEILSPASVYQLPQINPPARTVKDWLFKKYIYLMFSYCFYVFI